MITPQRAIEIFNSTLEWAKQKKYPYVSKEEVEACKMAIEAITEKYQLNEYERIKKQVKDCVSSIKTT